MTDVERAVLTPRQAARAISQRLGWPTDAAPDRRTVKSWALKWCVDGEDFQFYPGRRDENEGWMRLFPSAVEKIVDKVSKVNKLA